MIKKNIQTYIKCITLTGAMILSIPGGSSAKPKSYNTVGFACMNLIEVKGSHWKDDFHDLAGNVYDMEYASFKRIANKMQKSCLQAKSLIDIDIDQNNPFLVDNEKEVKKFHENLLKSGDRYMYELAIKNNSRLIVTASIKKRNVEQFIIDKQNLLIGIKIYDLNSNTVGMEYLPVNKKLFDDDLQLMIRVEETVIIALDKALINIDMNYKAIDEKSLFVSDSADELWE